MPDVLIAIELTPEDLLRISGFDCGTETYQSDLAVWPNTEAELCMQRGTTVWMYVNQIGDTVGYGSLGTTNWRYPDSKSKRIPILIIPAVALWRK